MAKFQIQIGKKSKIYPSGTDGDLSQLQKIKALSTKSLMILDLRLIQ